MEICIFGKQYFINKVLLLAVILLMVAGSGLLGYFLKQVYQPLKEPVVERAPITAGSEKSGIDRESGGEEETVESIKVYIVGCVNKPGVVMLEKGNVIEDAIRLAGGATKEADLDNINLAYRLEDNTMLKIKGKTAAVAKSAAQPENKAKTAAPASDSKAKTPDVLNSGVDIISDSLGAVVADEQVKAGGNAKTNLVNINTATQAELEGLPNVGPATAKAIIEYREKNGGFKKVTDLMKITGIKQKTFDKIKDHICI